MFFPKSSENHEFRVSHAGNDPFALEVINLFNLPLRGFHGFLEIAGIEIHEPITDIGEIPIDPDILKFEAAIARAHKN